jgi:hypothetical protein
MPDKVFFLGGEKGRNGAGIAHVSDSMGYGSACEFTLGQIPFIHFGRVVDFRYRRSVISCLSCGLSVIFPPDIMFPCIRKENCDRMERRNIIVHARPRRNLIHETIDVAIVMLGGRSGDVVHTMLKRRPSRTRNEARYWSSQPIPVNEFERFSVHQMLLGILDPST